MMKTVLRRGFTARSCASYYSKSVLSGNRLRATFSKVKLDNVSKISEEELNQIIHETCRKP